MNELTVEILVFVLVLGVSATLVVLEPSEKLVEVDADLTTFEASTANRICQFSGTSVVTPNQTSVALESYNTDDCSLITTDFFPVSFAGFDEFVATPSSEFNLVLSLISSTVGQDSFPVTFDRDRAVNNLLLSADENFENVSRFPQFLHLTIIFPALIIFFWNFFLTCFWRILLSLLLEIYPICCVQLTLRRMWLMSFLVWVKLARNFNLQVLATDSWR